MDIHRQPWILGALVALALATTTVAAQDQVDADDPAPRTLRDPAQALPSRGTGEAVLEGREAFDRETPQFQLGRRSRRDLTADAAAAGAQLVGNNQNLSHDCEIGERVELVGDTNIVAITGQCLGLSVTGNGNQVTIAVVDEIRIEGADNDVRWQRGFTVERPNMLETGGRNRVQRLAGSD